MKTTISYSKAEHELLVQAAKDHAHALREQALDDFFADLGRRASGAVRAANRFAHSLLRHGKARRQLPVA